MDGKGRWLDNVFVERLWRSVKYEEIYLHAYETPREVKTALASYFRFYNERRPHQGLEDRTPDEMYFGTVTNRKRQRRMKHGLSTASRARVRGLRHARAAVDNPASQFNT